MGDLSWAIVLSLPFVMLPVEILMFLCVVGVGLADTNLIPYGSIYYLRFVPMGVLCFKALVGLLLRKSIKRGSYYLVKVWIPFLILSLLSVAYSILPSLSFQRVLSAWFVLIGFGIGIPLFFTNPKKMVQILVLISWFMGVGILYSLYSRPSYESIPLESYGRMMGIFNNPNTLGILSMQLVFILIYFWQKNKGRNVGKVIFGIMVGVAVTMLTTGSRASALGFSIGILVFLWNNSRIERSKISTLWTAVLIFTSMFLAGEFFFPEYAGSLYRPDISDRWPLWKYAWRLYMDGPFLGSGFGTGDRVFQKDPFFPQLALAAYAAESHNSFLRLLLDLGFIGVGFVVTAFVVLIRRAWKYLPYFNDPKLGVALLGVVTGSLVNSVLESWLFGFGNSSTIPFWLFLALLCHQTDQAELKIRQDAYHNALLTRNIAINRMSNVKIQSSNMLQKFQISK
jgi:O-antigen ligase